MNDDDNMPIHEQVYRVVVEGQEAEKRRANAPSTELAVMISTKAGIDARPDVLMTRLTPCRKRAVFHVIPCAPSPPLHCFSLL